MEHVEIEIEKVPVLLSEATADVFSNLVGAVSLKGRLQVEAHAAFVRSLEDLAWKTPKEKKRVEVPRWIADKLYDLVEEMYEQGLEVRGRASIVMTMVLSEFARSTPRPETPPEESAP